MNRRQQRGGPASIIICTILALLGQACSTIGHKPAPEGWPRDIVIYEHVLSLTEVIRHCYHAVPLWQKLIGTVAIACNTVNLELNRCDIYRTAWTPMAVMDEEYDHCLGRDHEGETVLADYFEAYRKRAQ